MLTLLGIAVLGLGPAGSVLLAVFLFSFAAVLRDRPSPKHFGPLLLVWGLAMLMLIVIRDLGSSLMFFGGFLALLYVATGAAVADRRGLDDVLRRRLLPLAERRARAGARGHLARPVQRRAWWTTRATSSRSRCSRRPTAACSGRASARRCSTYPGGGTILPAAHTDLIYAVLVNEAGLFGAAGLIGAYLLLVYRGLRTALSAADGFSKLLATGLTGVLAIQVFVIVGGVTRVIPLTGVTLPFVSYGGSSIVANMVLLALLLIVSDHARSEAQAARRAAS